MVHRVRAGRRSPDRCRGDDRALHRLLRRRGRRTDRDRRSWTAWRTGLTMRLEAETQDRQRGTRWCAASARAAWRTSGRPTIRCSGARSRSSSSTSGSGPTSSSSSGSAARRRPLPASSTRISSRSIDRGEHEGPLLHRDGVRAGRRAQGSDRARPLAGGVGRDRPPGPDRSPLRACPRDRPPRPEAAQRPGRRRGTRSGDRLRHCPRRGLRDHADRLGAGHGSVPLARAGAGPRDDAHPQTSTRSA